MMRRSPSRMNATGQPTEVFHLVTVEQKMLSRFQTKNPRAKVAAPEAKRRVMAERGPGGSLFPISSFRSKYVVRKMLVNMMLAKTAWW